jgi:hypothetical protein
MLGSHTTPHYLRGMLHDDESHHVKCIRLYSVPFYLHLVVTFLIFHLFSLSVANSDFTIFLPLFRVNYGF